VKKSAILGMGVSGKAILRYLIQQGEQPLLIDKNPNAIESEKDLITYTIHSEDAISLNCIDRLIVSPGIQKTHPLITRAITQGIEITSELEIALESLQSEPSTIFAITGSCGKTTTTSLVTHVLRAAGKKAKSYGNIGYPLINYWLEKPDYVVIELSSAQLEHMQQERACLDAAVILNISPNHLDYHADMDAYIRAKMRIGCLLKPGAPFFITESIKEEFGNFLSFSTLSFFDQEKVAAIFLNSYNTSFAGDIKNSQAAYALCKGAGISKESFSEYCRSFQKPEHRFEFLRSVQGVVYINDSKATTVTAVIEAVRALPPQVILIAGGVDKGVDFSPWREAFKGRVSLVLLIGKSSSSLASVLSTHLSVCEVGTLEHAVEYAASIAKSGDYVLLSPGCASYDQFVDYQQRGKHFKELVLKL
jgi:UDP-N-acetylmuramoylalanine--D-glutamate ligase